MTCIVGVKTQNGVLLGGDSMGSDERMGAIYVAPKVFHLAEDVAVGMCGSFRMGQILEHELVAPPIDRDERKWAITTLIPVIREAFELHGYAHIKDNEETGGTFLMAVRSRLFVVQDDYSVLEPREPFHAVGCGEMFALGAMHALWKPKLANPRAFLKAALDAASNYSLGVAPPYNFTSTG